MDKGTASNLISATVLTVGLVLGFSGVEGTAQTLVLFVSMFAFSGGLTNAIAVTMLFDRVPGLYGSGVIQTRFTEIRKEIKTLILEQFFTHEHLREFLEKEIPTVDLGAYLRSEDGRNPVRAFVDRQWDKLTDESMLRPILREQVDKILNSSMGGLLALVGRDTIQSVVTKFVGSFIESMQSRVQRMADEFTLDTESLGVEVDQEKLIADVRQRVEALLEHRLQQLSPQQVKRIVEDVIRNHLGWLVVWGNVFGALMGLAAPFLSGAI